MSSADPNIQILRPLHGIYLLLENIYTRRVSFNFESIIELNVNGLSKHLEELINDRFFELTDLSALEKLNEEDKSWQKPTFENIQRKHYLSQLLCYTHYNHVNLLQMKQLRELVSIRQIKTALQRSSFINFSIQETKKNYH